MRFVPRSLLIIGLVLGAWLLGSCLESGPVTRVSPVQTPGATEKWYTVYFTAPDTPGSRTLRGGPDATLAQAIDQARLSVDIAAYDLDLWSMRDALIAAHRRGVAVRVVTESDNIDVPEIQQLQEAGIPVLGDRREGLMHDKFAILDRYEVWTGSMNYTINGAYRNNNNLLRIRSSQLAENFTTEFEEMFVDDRFGPGFPANTPQTLIWVDGTLVETYFSPDDGVASRIIELIRSAEQSIYFMAYSFTSDDLARALVERTRAGLVVAGVLEESQVRSNFGGEYENLRRSGLDVRLDGAAGNMHHKVLIIDGRIVVTGSYNFSQSAETKNDENVLIIHSPTIADQYLAEFEKLFAAAHD